MFSLEFRRYARMFMVSSPARLPSRGSLMLRLLARRGLSKILAELRQMAVRGVGQQYRWAAINRP
jgi:hypothetical protein